MKLRSRPQASEGGRTALDRSDRRSRRISEPTHKARAAREKLRSAELGSGWNSLSYFLRKTACHDADRRF